MVCFREDGEGDDDVDGDVDINIQTISFLATGLNVQSNLT